MTIRERVSATHILQRFVRMSRMLLPSYYSLIRKDELSEKEVKRLRRISSVYDSFDASPEASVLLIDSNIIELIQQLYDKLKYQSSGEGERKKALEKFIQESDRLINSWNYQVMN